LQILQAMTNPTEVLRAAHNQVPAQLESWLDPADQVVPSLAVKVDLHIPAQNQMESPPCDSNRLSR
jgi:hypothetical protein